MNKEEFLKQVRERMGEFLPPEYRSAEVVVREYDVLDEKRYGLALINGEPERVPVVDLEEAFKGIQEGRSIDDVLNEVAEIYMQCSCSIGSSRMYRQVWRLSFSKSHE